MMGLTSSCGSKIIAYVCTSARSPVDCHCPPNLVKLPGLASTQLIPTQATTASETTNKQTCMVNEPLLISSSSSPDSAAKARVLQTSASRSRRLSFPTRAGSEVAGEEAVEDAGGPSKSSDIICEVGRAASSRHSCKKGPQTKLPTPTFCCTACNNSVVTNRLWALTDTRDTAAASSSANPRPATPSTMSATVRLASFNVDSEGEPTSCARQ